MKLVDHDAHVWDYYAHKIAEDLAYYDALPQHIKTAVRLTDQTFNSRELFGLRHHLTVDQIELAGRQATRKVARELWPPGHPQGEDDPYDY